MRAFVFRKDALVQEETLYRLLTTSGPAPWPLTSIPRSRHVPGCFTCSGKVRIRSCRRGGKERPEKHRSSPPEAHKGHLQAGVFLKSATFSGRVVLRYHLVQNIRLQRNLNACYTARGRRRDFKGKCDLWRYRMGKDPYHGGGSAVPVGCDSTSKTGGLKGGLATSI